MACKHKTFHWESHTYEDANGEEYTCYERVENSLMVDIDTGRMKCSACGAIEYYTGQWRDFWEKGIPCLGSEKYTRNDQ